MANACGFRAMVGGVYHLILCKLGGYSDSLTSMTLIVLMICRILEVCTWLVAGLVVVLTVRSWDDKS